MQLKITESFPKVHSSTIKGGTKIGIGSRVLYVLHASHPGPNMMSNFFCVEDLTTPEFTHISVNSEVQILGHFEIEHLILAETLEAMAILAEDTYGHGMRTLNDAAKALREAATLRAQLSEAQARLADELARVERLREDVHTAWRTERECRERLVSQATAGQHTDDVAVDRFAEAMKAKMAASRAKGRGGWERTDVCPPGSLQQMLLAHIAKGDPVDVGNFAMMIFNRGEATAAQAVADDVVLLPAEATEDMQDNMRQALIDQGWSADSAGEVDFTDIWHAGVYEYREREADLLAAQQQKAGGAE